MQCEIAEVAICFQAGKGFDGEQSRNLERSSTHTAYYMANTSTKCGFPMP